MNLIDREALMFSLVFSDETGSIPCGQMKTVLKVVKAQPLAQPERRKGRWRNGVCECGYDWAKDAPISSVPNFCPQCGADMRGEQDE